MCLLSTCDISCEEETRGAGGDPPSWCHLLMAIASLWIYLPGQFTRSKSEGTSLWVLSGLAGKQDGT